ncbi:MAG: DUF433 domain-containing protein, partial [Chloroflexota bacterium]|nr:DUF433 domain-containing protein [Chloroflexota bacterium]
TGNTYGHLFMERNRQLAGRKRRSFTATHELGAYVVADPEVCHGQLTFRGTRILVLDIFDYVVKDTPRQTIVENCWGRVPAEGIAEAIRLAREALLERVSAPTAA